MISTLKLTFSSILVIVALSLLMRAKRRARGLRMPRGPPSGSWLTGHETDIRCQPIAGENEMKWIKQYGLIVRLTGCLGQNNLLVVDPKALQYIFQTSGYRFPKTGDMHHFWNSWFGPGIVTVDGEEHRRQRHILNPAFSVGQLKSLLDLFQAEGRKLTEKLEAHLASESAVVDILPWTAKVALDLLGLAAFRHAFGALDGKEDELGDSLKQVMTGATLNPKPAEIVYTSLVRVLPGWLIDPLDSVVASRTYSMPRTFRALAHRISKDIIQKAVDDVEGHGEKDIVGLLASSLLSKDKNKGMDRDAMMAQMATFIAGGQDTTSNTLGSLLYQLARNPIAQERLRDEIREMLKRKNGEPLTSADYDALSFLNACIKETLRLHPVVHSLFREAAQDDILPLSEPLTLDDGTTCMELPIKKGQVVYASVLAYQRLQSLWGIDADDWNPDRFLGDKVGRSGSNVGVYANLLIFSAGNRACIGWRFALMELQVLTLLLVNKFSFEPDAEIKFVPTQMNVFPALEGKYEEGSKLPLKVKTLAV